MDLVIKDQNDWRGRAASSCNASQGRIQGEGSLGSYEPPSETKKFFEAILVGTI